MKKKSSQFEFGFIGIGRMAEVILRSMLNSKIVRPQQVLVSRNNKDALKKLAKELKVSTTTDNKEVAKKCEVIWMGVKPYQASAVLSEIRPHLRPHPIFLSMMAGVSTQFLKRHLGHDSHVIRLMPNTPALLGAGMTGVYFPKGITKPIRNEILKILESLGEVLICEKEKDLDAVTGLSGSGVAFVYLMAKGLIDGGIQEKLNPKAAHTLAVQTLLGAARMLKIAHHSPQKLIKHVVSKGGTTEAGLKLLVQKKTSAVLTQAVRAATQRAKKIREENDRCMP